MVKKWQGFLLHLPPRLHPSQSERDPAETANKEMWLATVHCACIHTCFFRERPLEAGRRPLRLFFPELVFSLLPSPLLQNTKLSVTSQCDSASHWSNTAQVFRHFHLFLLSPLYLRQTVRRQPHANSSLNAPQGGPTLCSRKVSCTNRWKDLQQAGGGKKKMTWLNHKHNSPHFPHRLSSSTSAQLAARILGDNRIYNSLLPQYLFLPETSCLLFFGGIFPSMLHQIYTSAKNSINNWHLGYLRVYSRQAACSELCQGTIVPPPQTSTGMHSHCFSPKCAGARLPPLHNLSHRAMGRYRALTLVKQKLDVRIIIFFSPFFPF